MPCTFADYSDSFTAQCAVPAPLGDHPESDVTSPAVIASVLATVRQTLRLTCALALRSDTTPATVPAPASANADRIALAALSPAVYKLTCALALPSDTEPATVPAAADADADRVALAALSSAVYKAWLAATDLTPYLPALARTAERMARAKQHRAPRNAVSLVRRFLRVVVGADFEMRVPEPARFVPDTWAPVLDTCSRIYDERRSRYMATRLVSHLAILAFEHHVIRPQELPGRETVETWMRNAGWDANEMSKGFVVVWLREVLGSFDRAHRVRHDGRIG